MHVHRYTIPGASVIDHRAQVPLDWLNPEGEKIEIFVRELSSTALDSSAFPYLIYFQGGPGGKAMRPLEASGWIGVALKRYRVLLLDQRGTGNSHPITAHSVKQLSAAEDLATYLSYFRADSIVADAEFLRVHVFKSPPWTTLGQSYGGFISLTYVSFHPEGLAKCLITGGIPSIYPSADDVYRHTYPRVLSRNQKLFELYPELYSILSKVYRYLRSSDVYLPDGDLLTVERVMSLGLDLGMTGGYQRIFWLFEHAFDDDGRLSTAFLYSIMEKTSCVNNPLFYVLQETIYGSGAGQATHWAAERIGSHFAEFDLSNEVPLFTGEMVFSWMFEQIKALKPFKDAVHDMALFSAWSKLYDLEALKNNRIPIAACIYTDDMYVDYALSMESAQAIGHISIWETSDYHHDGLHVSDGKIFAQLDLIHA